LVPFPSPIASQLSDFGRPRASSCNDTPYEGEITTARLKLKSRESGDFVGEIVEQWTPGFADAGERRGEDCRISVGGWRRRVRG
jgi:hypothetical protein